MVQSTLMEQGGAGTVPLPLLHSHQHDGLVSVDTGAQGSSRSETLRHSIVEMAGRADQVSQDQGQRKLGNARIYHLGQLDSSRHIRQHLSDIEASCGGKARIALVTKRRDRIDLDITKSQKQTVSPIGQNSAHDQHAVSTHQPHPPPLAMSPKDRASAWLLKRFRKRHEKSAGHQKSVHGQVNETRPSKDKALEPRKQPAIAPGSGKRNTSKQDHAKLLSTTVKKTEPSFQVHPSAPPGHSGDATNAHCVNDYGVNDAHNQQQSSTAKDLKSMYEVRGTAIHTPIAQERSSHRQAGLFSASLEAFKRRLKISSTKHAQRLFGDELNGTESYVIKADRPDLKPENHRASTAMPKLHTHGRQYSAHTRIQNASTRPLVRTPPLGMFTDAPLTTHPTTHFQPQPPKEPRPLSKTRINISKDGESPENGQSELSPSKPHNSPTESPRFTYKLPDTKNDEKEVSFDDGSKLHVPSVKTYVLQSSSTPSKDKSSQPVPLTMHNLKLHESLHAIYERRRKRLERHHKNFANSSRFNLSDSSNGSGETGASERMWQWLKEATKQSTVPSSELTDDGAGDVTVTSSESETDKFPLTLRNVSGKEPIFV